VLTASANTNVAAADLERLASTDVGLGLDVSVTAPVLSRSNTAEVIPSVDNPFGDKTVPPSVTQPQNVQSTTLEDGTLSAVTASTQYVTDSRYVTRSYLSSGDSRRSNSASTKAGSFSAESVATESHTTDRVVTPLLESTNSSLSTNDHRTVAVSSASPLNSTYYEKSVPSSVLLTEQTTIDGLTLESATTFKVPGTKPSVGDETTAVTATLTSATDAVHIEQQSVSSPKHVVSSSSHPTEFERTNTVNESVDYSSRKEDTTALSASLSTSIVSETVAVSNDTIPKQTTSGVSKFQDETSSPFSRTTLPTGTESSSSEVSVSYSNTREYSYSSGATKSSTYLSDFTADTAAAASDMTSSDKTDVDAEVTTVSETEEHLHPTSQNMSLFTSSSSEMEITQSTNRSTPHGVSVSDQSTAHSSTMLSTLSIHPGEISSIPHRSSASNLASTEYTETSPVSGGTFSFSDEISSVLNSSEPTVTHPVYPTLAASQYPVSSERMSYHVQTATDRASSTTDAVTATFTGEWTITANESVHSYHKDDAATPLSTDGTPETATVSSHTVLEQTVSSVSEFQDSTSSYFSRPFVRDLTASSISLMNTGTSGVETTSLRYSVAISTGPDNVTGSTVLPSIDDYSTHEITTPDNSSQSTQSSVLLENATTVSETEDSNYTQLTELPTEDYFTTSKPATSTGETFHSWSSSSIMDTTLDDESPAAVTTPASAVHSTSVLTTATFSGVVSHQPTGTDAADSTHSDVGLRSASQTVTVLSASFGSSAAASSYSAIQTDASTSQNRPTTSPSRAFSYTAVQTDAGRTSDDSLLLTGPLSTLSAGLAESTTTSDESIRRDNNTQTLTTSVFTTSAMISTLLESTEKTGLTRNSVTEETPSPTAVSLTAMSAAVTSNLSADRAEGKLTSYSTVTSGVFVTSDSDEVLHSVAPVTVTVEKSDSEAPFLSTKMPSSTADGSTELTKTTEGPVEMKSAATDSSSLFVTADLPDRTPESNSSRNVDLTVSQSTSSSDTRSPLQGRPRPV